MRGGLEGRENHPGNRKAVPKPLLEADAPWSGPHEGRGAGVVGEMVMGEIAAVP